MLLVFYHDLCDALSAAVLRDIVILSKMRQLMQRIVMLCFVQHCVMYQKRDVCFLRCSVILEYACMCNIASELA